MSVIKKITKFKRNRLPPSEQQWLASYHLNKFLCCEIFVKIIHIITHLKTEILSCFMEQVRLSTLKYRRRTHFQQ